MNRDHEAEDWVDGVAAAAAPVVVTVGAVLLAAVCWRMLRSRDREKA